MNDAVAIVIVNYRTPDLTLACIAALEHERAQIPGLRVVVVDGGSGDGSAEAMQTALQGRDWVQLIALDFNGGFGWANNQGMLRLLQQSDPPVYIHLLNPDTVPTPGAVIALRETLRSFPACAAVGSQLVDEHGTPLGSAFRFPSVAREFFRGAQMNRVGRMLGVSESILRPTTSTVVDWVTGASVMFRAEALRQVGLFDSGFFLYYEEVELMHRLTRAGWEIRFTPHSRVQHIGGAATGMAGAELHERSTIPEYMFASRQRFFALAWGKRAARRAARAWLAGNRLLRTVKSVGLMKLRPSADAERAGVVRQQSKLGVLDLSAGATRWGDPPGRLPAWHRVA